MGLIFSMLIVGPSVRRGSLTGSGGVAAIAIGVFLYGLGGPSVFSVLIAFFLSASVLSKFSEKGSAEEGTAQVVAKGNRRDHIQALANGGPAVIMVLLYGISGYEGFRIGAVMSLAAAGADTWASELGVLSASAPVFIIKRKEVPKGISGGVTFLGFVASFLGALFVAGVYGGMTLALGSYPGWEVVLGITAIGFLGSIIDSILGELWQAQYQRVSSGKVYLTEKPWQQGKRNTLVKGYSRMDNNLVNFLSALSASLIGVFLWML